MSIENYINRQAKLIVFMFDNGFKKEEVIAAVNAIRVLKDLEMIVDILERLEK